MHFKNLFRALTLTMIMALTISASAQKFGHLNSSLMLQDHPKVQEADVILEEFQKAELAELQKKAEVFDASYKAFLTEYNQGNLSQVRSAELQKELTAEQEKLKEMETTAQYKLQLKRQQLLEPILKELDEAIRAYGTENGFTMIFDTSVMGTIVFAEESQDLTAAIKQKVGY